MDPNTTPQPAASPAPQPEAAPTAPVAPASSQPDTGYISNPFALFGPGWQAIKVNLGTWVQTILLAILIFGLTFVLPAVFLVATSRFHSGAWVALAVVAVAFLVGVYALARFAGTSQVLTLAGAKGQHLSLGQAFSQGKPFGWRILAFSILYAIIVGIGFILLIVPGVLLMTWYALTPVAIVEENLSIGAAMKRSKDLAAGRFWEVFGVIAMPQLLSILNIIPILGAIAAVILGIMYAPAPALRFLMLKKAKDSNATLPPVSPLNYAMILGVIVVFILSLTAGLLSPKNTTPTTPNYNYSTDSSSTPSQ
jgi:hypothetical protein